MAVIGADEDGREGILFAESEGKLRWETIEAESACNSFWEAERTGAGATGAEGPFCPAQQAELQQGRLLQHVFVTGEIPDVATIGYAARENPSSIATAILVTFKAMPFSCSCLISKP
jgi:hypothetical protein